MRDWPTLCKQWHELKPMETQTMRDFCNLKRISRVTFGLKYKAWKGRMGHETD